MRPIIDRAARLAQLRELLSYSPVVAILGPRQCGKTTLAKMIAADHYFDLENPRDLARLENPQTTLEKLEGVVCIDEIQLKPDFFPLLRHLVDHHPQTQYLILGSASEELIQKSSQSLAGRVAFLHLHGFDLVETGVEHLAQRWFRGGFPRAFLAPSDRVACSWLDHYISTFLERDLAEFGFRIPSPTMRRFWTMLSHCHGGIVNYSELGRSLQVTDKTVRSYLDVLAGTFMVRVLPPWFNNTSKRLVKSPKVYLSDSGIFHRLQLIGDLAQLVSHPKLGASWEGFVINQIIRLSALPENTFYFWSTHTGAEVDLFWQQNGKNHAVEVKYADAPRRTKSMVQAVEDLKLDKLWIVYPGPVTYALDETITVLSIRQLRDIFS
jgi:predicted AAA+ superfamily ATPase